MRTTRLITIGGSVLAAGGVAWLAKLAVIAATDGRVTDTGLAAVFFVLGVALLPAGLALLGAGLAAGHHVALRVAAALGGVVVFGAVFSLMDGVAGPIEDAGPGWLDGEGSILATAVLLGASGLTAARRGAALQRPVAA